ncbi:MAG: CehA/McbA family metallohydrolase [Myxococcota bacterium]
MTRLPTALRSSLALGFAAVGVAVSCGESGTTETSGNPTSPQPEPAILDFQIVDARGHSIPGRLTLIDARDPERPAFPTGGARSGKLALRSNVVSSPTGRGRVAVSPGRYTVVASRGLEWSIDTRSLTLEAGRESPYRAILKHEIDPGSWASGDFHLHTRDFSRHSDASLAERVITLLAEGIEIGVATDHDHATDYRSTAKSLEKTQQFTPVTGSEISTPHGHFNVFPLDPRSEPPGPKTPSGELMRQVRALEEVAGTAPLVQVNHPRSSVAYFTEIELDPVTGTTPLPDGPGDFDLLEVMNENEGFGYYDADLPSERSTGSGRHWALGDWFNLLNRGHRYTAVGNSDSHTVYADIAGYPRNFVWAPRTAAAPPQASEMARALRAHQSFISLGPFVEFSVDGAPMGSDVRAAGGKVELSLRVRAASWVDVDRVKLIVNGDVVEEIPVPDTRAPVRLETTRSLEFGGDSWLVLVVEGDESLAPVVPDQRRPIRPLAVTNPVWIQTTSQGAWTSPWQQARAWAADPPKPGDPGPTPAPAQRALRLLAASEQPDSVTPLQIRRGLVDPVRRVRLAAARAAERVADPDLAAALAAAYRASTDDPYARVALLRGLATSDPGRFRELLLAEAAATQGRSLAPWGDELGRLTPDASVRDWWVAGFFPASDSRAAEMDASPAAQFRGKGRRDIRWQKRRSREDGFVDLRTLQTPPALSNNAIAYAQTYLYSPQDRRVPIAIGSDDGFELFLDGERILGEDSPRTATPWQNYAELPLRAGWNRVVMKVHNGVGEFGFYFQAFDEDLRVSLEPTPVEP